MSATLALKILAKFWWLAPSLAAVATIWLFAYQLDHITKDRDAWQKSAKEYQASAREWEASFKSSEALRQDEQQRAVQGVNASEASCDARVAATRSSAVKIERIVTKVPMECKPGESFPRTLADPRALADSLQ